MHYRVGKVSTLACLLATAAFFVAAGSGSAGNALHFQVTGDCVSDYNGGELHADAYGFTPNGGYMTEARYPNGHPVIGIRNPGLVDKLGHLSAWSWICDDGPNGKPLPAGIYQLTIRDGTTGLSVKAKLRVLPARCEYSGAKHCEFSQP